MRKGWPTGQMGRCIKGSLKTGWLLAEGSGDVPTAMPMLASGDQATVMAMGFTNMASNHHGGETNASVIGSGTSVMVKAPIIFTQQGNLLRRSGNRAKLIPQPPRC